MRIKVAYLAALFECEVEPVIFICVIQPQPPSFVEAFRPIRVGVLPFEPQACLHRRVVLLRRRR